MTWNYIAGFMDGEGSIVRRKHGFNIYISQTNFEVLDEIRRFVGSGYVYSISKRQKHWKDAWLYSAGGNKETHYLLSKIVDRLIVKKKQAEEAIKQLEMVLNRAEKRKELRFRRIRIARLLRNKGWSYRKIGEELGADFGYVRRLLLSLEEE